MATRPGSKPPPSSQPLGASIVTTLAAGYAVDAPADESRVAAAVHGFAEAGYWSAGILVAAAIAVWWIMPRPTATGATYSCLF
jgi:hypothetical protein